MNPRPSLRTWRTMSKSGKKSEKTDERFEAMLETSVKEMRKHLLEVSKQIAEKFIDVYHPRSIDINFYLADYKDFVNRIITYVKHCVYVGEGITISEARGALIGIACRYDNFKSPGENELRRQGIILAKLILDSIDSELTQSMIEIASVFKEDEDMDLPF